MDTPTQSQQPTGGKQEEPWWRPGVLLFFEASSWIGIPAVLALVIGNWIDSSYGTYPKGYYWSVAIALVISVSGMIKLVRQAKKVMDGMDNK